MPTYSSTTLGCKANQFDTFTVEDQLHDFGYQKVSPFSKPDLFIINTCSVTHVAERKSRLEIRKAKRMNPRSKVIVMGCYAELEKEKLYQTLPDIDLVVHQKDKFKIGDWEIIAPPNTQMQETAVSQNAPVRFNLKIQDGCQLMCHYCSIPFSRGKHQSTPLAEILKLAQRLVAQGTREIILTGINIGAYGIDLKEKQDLIQVIHELAQIPELTRIRISSIEPIYVTPQLLEAWAQEPKMCPHFHMPLQAGHTQTLKEMNRKYTFEKYLEKIKMIRQFYPQAAINADLMAGYPGETESIFEESFENIKNINFSRVHVFPYSKRTDTPAYQRNDHIAPEIIKHRVDRLIELGKAKQRQYAEQFIHHPLQVLIEEQLEDGSYSGLSENYIRCYLTGNFQVGELVRWTPQKVYSDLSLH